MPASRMYQHKFELSEREQRIWDLHQQGKTIREIVGAVYPENPKSHSLYDGVRSALRVIREKQADQAWTNDIAGKACSIDKS